MPVGEIGKNLQAITNCDTLSKRLKEQFGGLKKALEFLKYTLFNIIIDYFFITVLSSTFNLFIIFFYLIYSNNIVY
jgi:hypothetical protein